MEKIYDEDDELINFQESMRAMKKHTLITVLKRISILTFKKCKKIHFLNVQNQTNSKDTKEVPKIPKDFDQLVVSNMDKKTSQLFQYKGLKLEKHSEYDMFYLQSVIQNLKKHYVERHTVESFINSYSFYVQLRLLDRRLPKYGNVYLLINKEKKTCKVGMSYNIAKRYSKVKLDKEL